MGGAPERWRRWLDRFFESYYRHRPVNATFTGKHEFDDRLPDYSREGVGLLLDEMSSLRKELAALAPGELSDFEGIDHRLARGVLEIESWELASGRFHLANPAWYTGEAIFGLVSLLLREFAPLEVRLESLRARLASAPSFLGQAEENVRTAPRAFAERAGRECEGALAFFDDGLEHVPGAGKLHREAEAARVAFERFRTHLDSLPEPASIGYSCGGEAFELLLREGHCLDWSARDIAERALDALAKSEAELETGASRFGVSSWRDALTLLDNHHPAPDDYYQRYGEVWEESRRLALAKDLVTWPDAPVDYVPQPLWARKAAPHLYFLFYRSPAPLDRLPRLEYLAPAGANESVIKLNHVVHHGGMGHHIQNWHAERAESRIGRVAGVDCASRIAMFCGGTMTEGWASYATDLMDEQGFLTPLESYAESHTRARVAARAIVDVKLHLGAMSFDEAVAFYAAHTAMSQGAARSEAVKNAMFPGAAVIYFVGSSLIRELRSNLERRLGARFDLRRFHDEFLSHGSIPVALIARRMLAPY
jgi:uncharacterized protein (DUF885 family)